MGECRTLRQHINQYLLLALVLSWFLTRHTILIYPSKSRSQLRPQTNSAGWLYSFRLHERVRATADEAIKAHGDGFNGTKQ